MIAVSGSILVTINEPTLRRQVLDALLDADHLVEVTSDSRSPLRSLDRTQTAALVTAAAGVPMSKRLIAMLRHPDVPVLILVGGPPPTGIVIVRPKGEVGFLPGATSAWLPLAVALSARPTSVGPGEEVGPMRRRVGELDHLPEGGPTGVEAAPSEPLTACGAPGWSHALATGEARIDSHHRFLFTVARDFCRTIEAGGGEHVYGELLETLDLYTRAHFAYEESCMDRTRCPNAERNREAHGVLLMVLAGFRDRHLARGAYDPEEGRRLAETLTGWLYNHIAQVDLGLRPCLGQPAGGCRADVLHRGGGDVVIAQAG